MICTVTGKVATPEVTVAISPTEVTLAASPLVVPAAVTTAFWPIATSLTTLSLTVLVTWNEPGLRMMNCAADELELLLAADAPPGLLTVLPTAVLICATWPLFGAVSVALVTAVCAVVTACCAWVTLAASCAAVAADEFALVPDAAFDTAVRSAATRAAAWSFDCWPRTWSVGRAASAVASDCWSLLCCCCAAERFCWSVWHFADDEALLQPSLL